jgi:hypothetical protein
MCQRGPGQLAGRRDLLKLTSTSRADNRSGAIYDDRTDRHVGGLERAPREQDAAPPRLGQGRPTLAGIRHIGRMPHLLAADRHAVTSAIRWSDPGGRASMVGMVRDRA